MAGAIRCSEIERIANGEFAALVMDCNRTGADLWKSRGAPVAHILLDDFAQRRYYYLGVPKNAAHPNLAALYIVFGLTEEGQAIYREHWSNDLDSLPGSMQRNVARYQVITGRGYRPRLIKLGRGVYVAWGFLFLYLSLGQIIPMLALDFISWRNYQELPWELIATGAKNTAILVVLAPTIVVALSLAFSWVVLRSRIRRRAIFDFFAFLPHAVPNIIFAIALLLISLFVLKDIVPIYGTIWVILIGFVIVRLSYRTRMMNGALIQVHRELEEASYISGSRTWACSALC